MSRLVEIVRVRMRIASDLHDDIGSTLSQIAILSEVARAQIAQGADQAAEPIARIGALSRESLDSMGDIVWAIDPQKDSVAHLSQRMRRLAAELLGARGLRFRFETGERRRTGTWARTCVARRSSSSRRASTTQSATRAAPRS